MILTLQERLILANQYKILALLDEDESEYHERSAEAIKDGYEFFYDELVTWFAKGDDVVSEEEGRLVIDILAMFQSLNWAVERRGLPEGVDEHDVKFIGFDGNNEAKFLGFAEHYCVRPNDSIRFESMLGEDFDFNSHLPTIDMYSRMREVWMKSGDRDNLTDAEISAIAEARMHPDNRL